jgi:hypothetical protein
MDKMTIAIALIFNASVVMSCNNSSNNSNTSDTNMQNNTNQTTSSIPEKKALKIL